MSDQQFEVIWLDDGRDPKCPPNPDYPKGIDVVVTKDGDTEKLCVADLPYPAKRCGMYIVKCKLCGYTVMLTTAGRADDPRRITFSCNKVLTA